MNNNNNVPHYTELPIAQLEENKGQIDGLPANPRNIQPDKLAYITRLLYLCIVKVKQV